MNSAHKKQRHGTHTHKRQHRRTHARQAKRERDRVRDGSALAARRSARAGSDQEPAQKHLGGRDVEASRPPHGQAVAVQLNEVGESLHTPAVVNSSRGGVAGACCRGPGPACCFQASTCSRSMAS